MKKKQESKISLKDNIRFTIVFLVMVLSLVGFYIEGKYGDNKKDGYIIHALGGMDSESDYINSIDCLRTCYDAGYRYFEGDVSFTSDGILVMAHSGENNVWSESDWNDRLGQPYPFGEGAEIPEGYDAEKHLATYRDFMSFKIQGKYRATSFDDVLDFMETHTDMYLMVDAGYRSYEDTQVFYQEVVKEAAGRTDVLDRLIVGGQSTDMVKAAKEAYDFPLVNLYYIKDSKREDIISTPEKFVQYCKRYGIKSFSISSEIYTKEVARELESEGLKSYVFTVNDKKEEKKLRKYGADVIGTDTLWEH